MGRAKSPRALARERIIEFLEKACREAHDRVEENRAAIKTLAAEQAVLKRSRGQINELLGMMRRLA